MDREHKGQSVIAFPDEYVVVDLETTGYSPRWNEIIEIGAIRVKNGAPISIFQQLIKPDQPIDDFMSELTGITNAMVSAAPKIQEVLPHFRDFLGDTIILGQNTGFDVNFLYDNYMKIFGEPLTQDYINIMRFSKKLFPQMEHHRLSDIAEACGVGGGAFHRALSDCEYTYKAYEKMKELVSQLPEGKSGFTKSFKKSRKKEKKKPVKLSELTTDKSDFDKTHPLYGKVCVFTGTLDQLSRVEAAQLVLSFGGECQDRVTKKTSFLILGGTYPPGVLKGEKSSKQLKAESYIAKGYDIMILQEDDFYNMVFEE